MGHTGHTWVMERAYRNLGYFLLALLPIRSAGDSGEEQVRLRAPEGQLPGLIDDQQAWTEHGEVHDLGEPPLHLSHTRSWMVPSSPYVLREPPLR